MDIFIRFRLAQDKTLWGDFKILKISIFFGASMLLPDNRLIMIFCNVPRVGKEAALKKINEISHKINLSWIFCFAVNRVASYKNENSRKFYWLFILAGPCIFFLTGVLYSAKKGGVGRSRLIKSIDIPICAHSKRKLREKSAESFKGEL